MPSEMLIKMKKDLIQKTLGKQIRIVLECPFIETLTSVNGEDYRDFTCYHPKATYREHKSLPAICGAVERLNSLKGPIFKGRVTYCQKKFVCPYNKIDENFARGIQTRKI